MEGLGDPRAARACSSCGVTDGLLVDVGGSPVRQLCAGCLARAVERAKAKLCSAWWIGGSFLTLGLGIGVGGAIFTALSGQPAGELTPVDVLVIGSLEGLVTAYSAWSLFWGIPVAMRWWMGLSEKLAGTLGQGTRFLPQAPSS